MFELSNQTCTITSVNPRAENHGEEHVLAADLSLTCQVSNTILDTLGANFRTALYTNATASGHNMALDLEQDHLPNLRFPVVKELPLDIEVKGCQVDVELPGSGSVYLGECKLSKIKIAPKEGGTVELSFKLAAHPEPSEIGALSQYIKDDVTVSLRLPDIEPEQGGQSEIDED